MNDRRLRVVQPRSDDAPPPGEIRLDNCAREPIHIPGAIQPHGALVAFEASTATIRHASTNLSEWLPVGTLPLRGRPLSSLIDRASWEDVEKALAALGTAPARHEIVTIRAADGAQGPLLQANVHRHRGQCVLEIEHAPAQDADWLQQHAHVTSVLREAEDLEDLVSRVATQVKRMTGFDRVMMYRFHSDWHGEVIAEARMPDMEAYLGLHYPASDIPAQARELYRVNSVRYIADVAYSPVPIVPWLDSITHEPLDLTFATLRSVSPIHLQYLHNMGVASTITMSIVVDGHLWGLVAAHHRAPTTLPLRLRQTCQAVALAIGYFVGWHLQQARLRASQESASVQRKIVAAFNQAERPLREVIEHSSVALLRLTGATSGVLWRGTEVITFGCWPAGDLGTHVLERARHALATQACELADFHELEWPEELRAQDNLRQCGMMVLRLAELADSGVAWLRPERRREVTWGGDPDKPAAVTIDAQGRPQLAPRASFARWTKQVRGKCRPWTGADREAARSLLPLRQMLALRASLAESRANDRRFRALLELQSDAYWQIDDRGRVVTLTKNLPFRSGSIIGSTLPELFDGLASDLAVASLRRALADGEPFRDLSIHSLSDEPDAEFELLISGDPLRDSECRIEGFHGTITDGTQRLRTGRELRRREAAELSSREKSLFLSQVSHELRTPLNAVIGSADLLLADPTASPEQLARAQTIQRSGRWLLSMISDLLDFGRVEAGRLGIRHQAIDICPLIEQSIATLGTEAHSSQTILTFVPHPHPVWVQADPVRLEQVLINLLSNAVKYNRRGGSVVVEILTDGSRGRARIAVRDTGMGMNKEQLEHIFEPFNRLGRESQQTPGTGIGLVIARQLIEAMGGSITVQSEPSRGSCFTIELETVTEESALSETTPPEPPDPQVMNRLTLGSAPSMLAQCAATRSILYVEDEFTNAELMRAAVERIGGVAMIHAETAEEGLELARDRRPDIVLVDLNLPGRDGTWFLKCLQGDHSLRRTPCIAVTADATFETACRLRGLGFDQTWTKPVNLAWVLRALRAQLDALDARVIRPERVGFDDSDAGDVLSTYPDIWLDTLDFGLIRLDAQLRATAYNLRESLFTGYEPAAVIGRRFFEEIAPCMNNPRIAGRFAASNPLDETIRHVLKLFRRSASVRLRLLADPSLPHRFLLIDWHDEP